MNPKSGTPLLPVLALLASVGCAGVTHKAIHYTPVPAQQSAEADMAKKANEEADKKATGIRYYEASPYLLVYTDGKGGLIWKIYYLPDQTRKREANPCNFIAKTSTTLNFNRGVLTDANTDVDSAAAPKALLSAIEKLLPLAFADAAPGSHKVLSPRLYKILIQGDEIKLAGHLEGLDQIDVTLK